MVVNQKVTGKTTSVAGGLAMGWGVSALITLLGVMLIAYLLNGEKIQLDSIGYGSIAVLLLSSIAGAGLAFRFIRRRRMLVCMLSGMIYFLSLVALTALFFGGQYDGIWVTGLVILGGSLAVGLMGLKGDQHREKRRYR